MTNLGSWALVQNVPSLLGLIPLILYIVLAFVVTKSMILPLAISVLVGAIMSGQGAVAFGQAFGAALGGTLGQIGFLVIMGAGLGGVMMQAGVTTAMCKWMIKGFKITSKEKAILLCAAVQFLLTLFIGSGVTSAAICFAFLLPIAALFAIHPVTMAVIEVFAGFVGMLLSPFSPPNITAMELTGTTYIQFELWAGLPFLIAKAVITIFVLFWLEKKMDKDPNAEVYTLTEEEKNYDVEISSDAKRAAIGFLVGFVLSVAYIVKFGGGMSFTFFYFVLLTVVVALLGKIKLVEAIDIFFVHGSRMIQIFVVCVLSQLLIDTINAMGGFEALGAIFQNIVGGAGGQFLTLMLATIVGTFGVSGVASTQIIVIDQLFGNIARGIGVLPGVWCMVLLLGSYITVVIYPSMTHFGALGLSRSKDMKNLLLVCWIVSLIELVFGAIYFLVVSLF